MGVEQPKIFLKKTRTSFEASASSDFSGDIEVDGEYSKEDGSFKGKLKANVTSDASTPTTAQVEKIKAMENAYNKYADNMTALGIAQAQAWQAAFESLTQMVPNTVGVIKANPKPSEPSAFDNMLAVWNSLTPEQKQAFLDKFPCLGDALYRILSNS